MIKDEIQIFDKSIEIVLGLVNKLKALVHHHI